MKERPILFSGPMVRALLDGRKTQTRRVVKPQPPNGARYSGIHFASYEPDSHFFNSPHGPMKVRCPYGEEEDTLWVREAWRADAQVDAIKPAELSRGEPIRFEADGTMRQTGCAMISAGRLRPGIHMPRWASRLTLEIAEIRAERLQAISEADAIAEGVEQESADPPFYYVPGIWPHSLTAVGVEESRTPARDSYAKLWKHINGPGSWAANPWVWVVSFPSVTEARHV